MSDEQNYRSTTKKALMAALIKGGSHHAAALILGLQEWQVCRQATSFGIKRGDYPRAQRRGKPKPSRKAFALLAVGNTCPQIALKIGVGRTTVNCWSREYKIKCAKFDADDISLIVQLKDHVTASQCAVKFECLTETIERVWENASK